MSIESVAQSTATFGAPGIPGSVNATCGPIARVSATSNEDFSQHYYLYTASDMAAAGVLPGSTITAIKWYKANNGATTAANLTSTWKVHMKNSTTMPSPTWCNSNYNIQSAGATLVYTNSSQVIPNTIGWITLPLSTPFVYTGGSLEVGSNWSCNLFTGNPTTSGISWNQFAIPNTNQTFGARGTSGSLVMINESCSPISQLVFTAPCSVPLVGNTLSTDTTVCENQSFTLSTQFPATGSGITYLWESADDNTFTTNLNSLGTTSTYTALASSSKYYRCAVTCSYSLTTVYSTPIFVNVYDPISIYAAGIDLFCNGDNLGEVYLSISGGNAPYTFNWNSGLYTTQDISGLSAGTYSVIATDANGCTATTSSTLTEPTALTGTTNVVNATAPGMSNGSITINALGGTPPYMYSIDGGVTYVASNVFTGLAPTLYYASWKDAVECVNYAMVTVNYNSTALVDNSIFIDVTDHEDTIAHIVWGMPSTFSAYTFQLERSNDGVNFLPIASINAPALVNILPLPTSSLNAYGTIMFTTEMQPRLLYNEVVPNLTPNTTVFYRVKFMNQTQTMTVYSQIKQFLPPPVLYQPWPNLNPAPCPPIGLPPTGYIPTMWTSTQQIGCCLITKRLYVKYGCAVPMPCKDCLPACYCKTDPCCVHNCAQYLFCGCTPWNSCGVATQYTWVVINSVYTAPIINTTQTNVSCNGGSNGSITILGGMAFCKRNKIIGAPPCFTATHTLPWPNNFGQVSNVFTGLCAGCYTIMVRDCNGCTRTKVVCITQPTPITLTATSVNTCSCTGSITVNASGGTPCAAPGNYTYQILPSGIPQTSNTFNNLCPGCYTIKVTDCNGCFKTIVKCVGAASNIITTVNTTNVTCYGACNGVISMLTPIPNPCLVYGIGTSCNNIVASGPNPIFGGLCAGTYCIRIWDICNNCDTCICVTITQPSPIILTASSVGTCACNGSVTVNATGGVPCTGVNAYTYQMLPTGAPQTSNTFNNLCVGCYTIMVTDCNGCTATIVKCVTASGTLGGMNLVKTNVSCFGGSDGSICATNAVGVANPCLKYKIGATCTSIVGTGTTNPCFNNLPAGSYCVKITDTCSGCDTCICVNITQPNPITLTATSVGTCSCTGSITVNAVGGILTATCPFYTYQILPTGASQTSNTFNNLCVGCYTIMVTDCNGCTATIVKCVTASGTLGGMNLVKTNVSCFGGSDGSICATNAVGVANPCLKYKIGATCTSIVGTGTTNPCFNNLPAGSYCVKITDTCSGCDTCICVNITQPNPITLTATSVGTCSCTGSITVNAVGGTPCTFFPMYTYQIFPSGIVQASPTFNNLCVGCYTIMVTDCNGCTATIVKCVTASGTLGGMNLVKTNVSCFGGSDGSICAISPVPTNPCLKYKIGATCTSIVGTGTTNPCFNNLPAGSYCVKITDTCSGCDTCICVNITQPSPITLTATSVGSCSCTGSITVTATGGIITAACPYTYQILPTGAPQTSNTFNNLCVGCYTIMVTDCNGCTATIVKCVTASGTLGGMNLVKTNVSCFGGSDGSICATNAVGVANPCLKYKIGATCTSIVGTGTTNPCFNNLPAGSYCVKITDTCSGCDTCICVNITQPNPITLTATSVGTCSCTGSITVNAVGGILTATCPFYTYQILPTGAPQTSNTFNNLCVGCYTIMVTDCNGCTATIVKCVTASGTLGGMNLVKTNVSCFGGSDGSICATNAVGVANPCLKYKIGATCTSIVGTGTTNPCFNNLPAGSYCVKITDTCSGCDTCICVNITQPSPITLTATSVTACPCNSSITVNAIGGSPCATGYTYQLLPGGLPQPNNTFIGLCAGCYTIVVTDCNGCTSSIVKCVGPCGANPIVVNLQLFLQGYYIGSQLMTPVLMNQGVSSSNLDVDSIEVELRNPLPPYNVITSSTAMLHVDGSASCSFFTSVQGPYQLAVKHRNSIQTWSSLPINATSSAPTFYNFTNAANKAFGDNMVEVEPGVWAFYTGDINQDENVDLSDYSAYELDVINFTSGYFATDINGDGNVDILDAPELESNIMNFIYSIHP